MDRDQIRQKLQRILETTKGNWVEQPAGAVRPPNSGHAGPRVDLSMKMLGTHKAQGVESQDGSTAPCQRAS